MKKNLDSRRGFSLVEVTIALGIATFCLMPLFGLLVAGLKVNRDSTQQTMAANIATSVVADLRATPSTSTVTPFYNINLSQAGASGPLVTGPLYFNEDGSLNSSPTSPNGPTYRASITVTAPAANSRASSTAWIDITWNALTDPTKTTPVGSYETVVSLNRN